MKAKKKEAFAEALIDLTQKHLDPASEEDRKCYKALHAVAAQWMLGKADKAWDALKGIDGELSDRINSIMN